MDGTESVCVPREPSEKEKAVFEAVFCLLGEGREFHDLKVADIAARAGIGKGTVYEYFPSKEEILPRALAYRFAQGFAAAGRLLDMSCGFEQTVGGLLDGAARMLTEAGAGAWPIALALLRQNPQLLKGNTENFARWCAAKMAGLCGRLALLGRAAGAVRPDLPPDYVQFVFSAAISAYAQHLGCASAQNREQARRFALDMLLAALR